MTTDITELAQSLKASANKAGADDWQAKKISGDFYVIRKGSYSSQCGYRTYQPIAEIDHKSTRDYVAIASPANVLALVEALEKAQQHIARQEQIILNQDESLSIRRSELETAQQERENWRTSFDNERLRADKLKAHIDQMEPIRAAAEKLVRCKGRYHSEQNYRALAALFGVTTPDLPPLDSESRIVTVSKSDIFNVPGGETYVGGEMISVDTLRLYLAEHGIKWEAE
ncbi:MULTISPECIES: ead/Ea22-like family protein [Klebsiella]|uniref:ead/Ea22-like family protein n=1 Tax=Klebsiella TaxID=570 RepID=UPI001E35EF0A|nr:MULTISPECIES: ead/Ea22-like family protein [Klebsiella]MEC6161732.1 ead/Ea22-like family protein [Klebsiella grimontii]UHD02035.1 ead/Ea22-like family protein [Klebsiella pasteurii]